LARLSRQRDAGGSRWLFVGRLAPNKCAHDVIGAFACYRQLFDPRARLALVGIPTSSHYLAALVRLVAELELGDAVELAGSVPFEELLAQFAMADVFVCLSEHEGYCVPVVEAMELGLPVVAYAAAAVPETVGDAALLLDDKDPLAVAVAVGDLLADPARLDALRSAGRARAEALSLPRSSARFLELVHQQLAAP
jgi:glycosyltransferase involved in cell wall biosynthesis